MSSDHGVPDARIATSPEVAGVHLLLAHLTAEQESDRIGRWDFLCDVDLLSVAEWEAVARVVWGDPKVGSDERGEIR